MMTAHSLMFDMVLPIRSVARTSDVLSPISACRNIILIALRYSLPPH